MDRRSFLSSVAGVMLTPASVIQTQIPSPRVHDWRSYTDPTTGLNGVELIESIARAFDDTVWSPPAMEPLGIEFWIQEEL